MTYSQQKIQNDRVYRFWNWLNSLNHYEYLRAQRLCSILLGGWVRGLTIEKNQEVTLIIEL